MTYESIGEHLPDLHVNPTAVVVTVVGLPAANVYVLGPTKWNDNQETVVHWPGKCEKRM